MIHLKLTMSIMVLLGAAGVILLWGLERGTSAIIVSVRKALQEKSGKMNAIIEGLLILVIGGGSLAFILWQFVKGVNEMNKNKKKKKDPWLKEYQ